MKNTKVVKFLSALGLTVVRQAFKSGNRARCDVEMKSVRSLVKKLRTGDHIPVGDFEVGLIRHKNSGGYNEIYLDVWDATNKRQWYRIGFITIERLPGSDIAQLVMGAA